jgi:hypothetical protein
MTSTGLTTGRTRTHPTRQPGRTASPLGGRTVAPPIWGGIGRGRFAIVRFCPCTRV